jgi:hypothetical protein
MRFLLLLATALGAGLAADSAPAARTWTTGVQAGVANTFQMTLGGYFGQGPYVQDRVSGSVNNIWRAGDGVTAFGWSTTDLSTGRVNYQAGVGFKTRVFERGKQSLHLTGGVQRWNLPGVKNGTRDWLVAGTLNYAAKWGRVPISVSQDSWSLVTSTLPTGSVVYTQIQTQGTLVSREDLQVAVRHGVHHTYSWNFYGASGNRVVRYGAALVLTWRSTSVEAACRQQFGLQDGIPYNRFWHFTVSRQITRPFGGGG